MIIKKCQLNNFIKEIKALDRNANSMYNVILTQNGISLQFTDTIKMGLYDYKLPIIIASKN